MVLSHVRHQYHGMALPQKGHPKDREYIRPAIHLSRSGSRLLPHGQLWEIRSKLGIGRIKASLAQKWQGNLAAKYCKIALKGCLYPRCPGGCQKGVHL